VIASRWRRLPAPALQVLGRARLSASRFQNTWTARLPFLVVVGPRAVDADVEIGIEAAPGRHQLLGPQFTAHRAGGQEGDAMSLQRHRLEALGHVGFVDPVQVQG
jgi:hypothetical protein